MLRRTKVISIVPRDAACMLNRGQLKLKRSDQSSLNGLFFEDAVCFLDSLIALFVSCFSLKRTA